MTTKTFELTLDERELMCRVLQHCMETNAECNLKYDVTHKYVWVTPEDKQEQEDMKALHAKLEVTKVQKSGWVRKYDIHVGDNLFSDTVNYVRVTWEEVE